LEFQDKKEKIKFGKDPFDRFSLVRHQWHGDFPDDADG